MQFISSFPRLFRLSVKGEGNKRTTGGDALSARTRGGFHTEDMRCRLRL